MFSKSCEYGIKATLFIAQKSQRGERVSLKEIAAATNSPTAFTAKILQILAKANIVNSTKGPNGGFEIEKVRLEKTSIKQIVLAIDGNQLFDGCALGLEKCNENEPCPMHEKFVIIRNQLNETLQSSTLLKVAKDLNLGLTVLKQ
ncbi:RrF2 family transcriptional regulator [Marinirhabdus gelatinilytica]|uniref:BadM/Rrf2 family transcriptional regulator n=1 Tax=Marinirhabdus gelatinilytica TaxID=1703343 RepID=A0A370QLD8_9FLAO|nr:Rrf2 family transcriptional regulator [Marinirhabdus gelatinilytica]RDK89186.1 BadM/Rrf2 family transcriptional regulator [Marinirhabdus gelatinilytica]